MQTTIKSVHEIAEANGYRFTGTCQCDGLLTQKFDRESDGNKYQIRWRKNRYLFRVLLNRQPLANWESIATLETYITKLHEANQPLAADPGTVS